MSGSVILLFTFLFIVTKSFLEEIVSSCSFPTDLLNQSAEEEEIMENN